MDISQISVRTYNQTSFPPIENADNKKYSKEYNQIDCSSIAKAAHLLPEKCSPSDDVEDGRVTIGLWVLCIAIPSAILCWLKDVAISFLRFASCDKLFSESKK